jgi:hypothetical protein
MSSFSCFSGIKKINGTIQIIPENKITTRKFCSVLSIESGDSSISIHFDTPDELITICNTHNIPLIDGRNQNSGEPA